MLMNVYSRVLVIFIYFSHAYCTINLLVNRIHKDNIRNSNLKYYKVNLRKNHDMDLALEAELTQYDQKTKLPIMILSTKELPNDDRSSQWICGRLGKEKCVVPRDYLKDSKQLSVGVFCEECEYTLKYSYENNANTQLITQQQNELRRQVSLPTIRLLQTPETALANEAATLTPETTPPSGAQPITQTPEPAPQVTSSPTSNQVGSDTVPTNPVPPSYWRNPAVPLSTEDKLNALRGAGVAGLLLGIMFILCVIIAYYIHIVIFVNTKFMTDPLKLGKIE